MLRALFLFGTGSVCFYVFKHVGYEASWLPLQELERFSFPAPYGHRLLFVLLADVLSRVFPSLTYLQSYLLSQGVALLMALEAIRRWGALFIQADRDCLAQPLLAMLLIPTLHYFTFFDFGIVFFFSACLLCLFKGRFKSYLILFALGTLNHEVTLLLIPTFMAFHFRGRLSRGEYWTRVTAQLVAWLGVRASLDWRLPPEVPPTIHLGANLQLLLHPHPDLILRYLGLGLWSGIAALGIPYAPPALKRCLILLPLLAMTSMTFGLIHEARLFDPAAPILVALILCLISGSRAAADRPAAPGP